MCQYVQTNCSGGGFRLGTVGVHPLVHSYYHLLFVCVFVVVFFLM